MATHVGVLDQGRLVQFGTPREIYEDPVSIYAASRLGQPRINILPADLFGDAPAGRDVDRAAARADRAGRGAEAAVRAASSISATRPGCICASTTMTS